MTVPSVEDRLRDAAEVASVHGDVPAHVLHAVKARRRQRGILAVSAVAIAVAGVVAVPVVIATNGSSGHSAADSGPAKTKKRAPAQVLPRPAATFAPLPAPPVDHAQPEPATFLALIGAGAEQLAVVDSRTGQVTKWLQHNGSQALMTFSADLSTAYQPTLRGCTATWTQINTATGASKPAFTDLGRPLEVALSATGSRIAYVHQAGGSMRLGCGAGTESLIVKDQATGAKRAWTIGPGGADSLYPAFDQTATRVAFVRDGRVWILDINRDADLSDAHPLSKHAPPKGCWQNKPVWWADSPTVLVSVQCPSSAAIVGYNDQTGQETYRHDMPGSAPIIASFAVDASGKHVIYALSGVGQPGGNVYAVEGEDRHITDGAYQLAW